MAKAALNTVSRSRGLVLLLVMGSMWGLQFAMLKLATASGHSEINILMVTMVLLSVAFSALVAVRGEWFHLNRERIVFLLITAVLGYVLPIGAALYAASKIPAGVLSLMACLAPVFSGTAALMLRTEQVSVVRLLAIGLGLSAAILVLWPELEHPGYGVAGWLLVSLLVPFCYGVESVYIAANWPKGFTPLQAVTAETLTATLMIVPIFLLTGDPLPDRLSWGPAEIGISVFVAAGLIESLIYFYLVRTTGGVFVSFGTFVSLFAGLAWGMLLFGESHGWFIWAAVVALCVSVALAIYDPPAAIAPEER